ncbi:nesprin-1-like, partial [Alosa alosa]|uniref:nesprin-1-like n=1 Tax=Alosa alosa TaxID=278164 RepID=UPI0020151F89
METGLRKRMEQVTELFADTTDVFQELQAVRTHLTNKMADAQAALGHIQGLQERLQEQQGQLSALLREVGVMASVAGPEALVELTTDSAALQESIAHTQQLLQRARERGDTSIIHTIRGECHAFEEWFQDLQLSVNECFENPERRQDVETALKRLTSFLSSKEGEQRLSQLRERVESSGTERLGAEPQAQLQVLVQEQQDELDTFRAHCRDRLTLMQDIMKNINSLQEEHDYFRDWLQPREHREPTGEELKQLHQEFLSLRRSSLTVGGRPFGSLLSSSQRRGLRGEALLTDSQAVLERFHSLGTRLEQRAQQQAALLGELQELNTLLDTTAAWVREHRTGLGTLDASTEQRRSRAESVLSLRSEGDSRLSSLRARVESVCAREGVEEERRCALRETLGGAEEQWRGVLQAAQELRSQAELQDSLSRELQQLSTQQESTLAWVRELQQGLDALARGTHGSPEHLEERLNRAQAILNVKSEGNGKLASLKKKVESLCAREDLDESRRRGFLQSLRDTDIEWRGVLQAAQEQHSVLKRVMERVVSCQYQKQQTQDRLGQLRKQTNELPHRFPWPGLGDRRQAVDQARVLLEKTRTLAPSLAGLRAMGRELYQITHDSSWTDHTWTAMEESVPGLLLELTELVKTLEEGIMAERRCVQLVEQHNAAQDWLREQVKGLPAPPTDRQDLQATINTLKALLQTVDREQREMKECDTTRDALIHLCTPGGQDSLSLEIIHLHELCDSSEQE